MFLSGKRRTQRYQDSLKRQGKARYYCNVKASRLQGPLLKHSPYLESSGDRILKLRQLALKISSDQQGKGGSAFGGRFEICDSVLGRGRKNAKFGSDGVFECGGEFGDFNSTIGGNGNTCQSGSANDIKQIESMQNGNTVPCMRFDS